MIELIIRAAIMMTLIIVIFASYVSLLYRQSKTAFRITGFVGIDLLAIVVVIILLYFTGAIKSIPFLGKLIILINDLFSAFFGYIPKLPLLIWFVVPVIIVWLIFFFKSGYIYEKIKKDYFEFMAKHQPKKKTEDTTVSEKTKDIEKVKKEASKALKTTHAQLEKASKKAAEKPKIEPKTDLQQATSMPPQQHFLTGLYPTTIFNYRSITGMKKALSLLKKRPLVLGKTGKGYVAIYMTSKGYQELKILFSKSSLDITPLKASPSIVFFTYRETKTIPLRRYVEEIERMSKV
ncbi:hypothetical protein [Lactobacillus johnsonii]|uniref:Uncharacterized protein n=1 Tax=Lactobacillus johnsonii TaxID=33959 RepID=A0A9X4X9L3_LACJH|nr:hypothetical protein [Lactobacillus johnsonii]MTE03619.1 hypothetical protein [Lactobacillus johnsonii]